MSNVTLESLKEAASTVEAHKPTVEAMVVSQNMEIILGKELAAADGESSLICPRCELQDDEPNRTEVPL